MSSDAMVNESYGDGWRIQRLGRAWVFKIERPGTLNAISSTVMTGFEHVIARVRADSRASSLVIYSEGDRTFVSGGDLVEFAGLDTRDGAAAMSRRMSRILLALESLPVPVVAAMDGDAYGGGVELSLACDIRLLGRDSALVLSHRRFALMPGWGGATRLMERCGRSQAILLLLNGARVSGEDAVRIGLADEICPSALSRATALVADWEQLPATVVQGVKRTLAPSGRAEQLEDEREHFLKCWMSEEHFEAVAGFLGQSADDPD